MRILICARIAFAAATACGTLSHAQGYRQLELGAAVPLRCTLNISPSAKASNLDMAGGENNILVGTLTESCNASNGYVVQIISSNKGQLITTSGLSSSANYQVQYDDAEGVIANALVANRNQAQFARQGKLAVSVPANSQRPAGSYSDTLSIVISAK